MPADAAARVVGIVERLLAGPGDAETTRPVDIRTELQEAMDRDAQVFRTAESLTHVQSKIPGLKERFARATIQDKGRRFNTDLLEAIELGFLLDLAEVILAGALAREESRGGHFREDFPTRDDKKFLKHTLAYTTPTGVILDYKPVVITKYEPKERVY
jgi:succinate dehydrogenase / fumarate reductase flavoprotein subunit